MEKNLEDAEFVQVGTVSLDPNFQEEDSEELRQLKKKLTAGRPTKTLYEQLEEQKELKRLEKEQQDENRFRPAYLDDEEALFVNQLQEKEELLFEYRKQKEREDIEAYEEARARKQLMKTMNVNKDEDEVQDYSVNDTEGPSKATDNESLTNEPSKKRKASDIDTASSLSQQQPIIVIKKKKSKKSKDSGKPKETKIIAKKSEKCHSNASSLPLQTKESKSQSKSSMQGLLGAYNDSDEEDDEDG